MKKQEIKEQQIIIENIVKKYNGRVVLDGISMIISRGESVAFIGNNGAGKSTLLKIMAGLVKPAAGTIKYHKALTFSYIPEHFPVSSLSLGDYMESMGRLDGLNAAAARRKSQELFEEFFIGEMAGVPMKHLSKGTLQKAGVVQALLKTPDVLLLDEPLSGQDMDSQAVFIQKIKQLKEQKVTILMSCHEPFLISRIADTVYRIKDGRISGVDRDSRIFTDQYELVFEGGDRNHVPPELADRIQEVGDQIKVLAADAECDELMMRMYQMGWRLRRMHHENHV